MYIRQRLLLKKPARLILPAVAGSVILLFVYSRLTTDTLERAGTRFGNAIKNQEINEILSFLEKDETIALSIDEAKLKRLLDLTLSKNYPGLKGFDLSVRNSDNILEVSLQNLESVAPERLSFAFVGEPGNFRSPGFTWNLISIAGKKEFPRTDVQGGLSAALAMSDYMLANEKELTDIGIPALFDPNKRALVPFKLRASLTYAKYEEAKTKSAAP